MHYSLAFRLVRVILIMVLDVNLSSADWFGDTFL